MTLNKLPPGRDVVVAHSSDLHMDDDHTARLHGGDGTAGLACVLRAASGAGADVVILAGDTFDSHRMPDALLARVAEVIAASPLPVVLVPGNHDPVVADAVYQNLHVLGVTHDEAVDAGSINLVRLGRQGNVIVSQLAI